MSKINRCIDYAGRLAKVKEDNAILFDVEEVAIDDEVIGECYVELINKYDNLCEFSEDSNAKAYTDACVAYVKKSDAFLARLGARIRKLSYLSPEYRNLGVVMGNVFYISNSVDIVNQEEKVASVLEAYRELVSRINATVAESEDYSARSNPKCRDVYLVQETVSKADYGKARTAIEEDIENIRKSIPEDVLSRLDSDFDSAVTFVDSLQQMSSVRNDICSKIEDIGEEFIKLPIMEELIECYSKVDAEDAEKLPERIWSSICELADEGCSSEHELKELLSRERHIAELPYRCFVPMCNEACRYFKKLMEMIDYIGYMDKYIGVRKLQARRDLLDFKHYDQFNEGSFRYANAISNDLVEERLKYQLMMMHEELKRIHRFGFKSEEYNQLYDNLERVFTNEATVESVKEFAKAYIDEKDKNGREPKTGGGKSRYGLISSMRILLSDPLNYSEVFEKLKAEFVSLVQAENDKYLSTFRERVSLDELI